MAQKEYRRIGGRGKRRREFFTWNTLWIGADHLLQIEHTGYSEEYKRFYFRDIQSFTVRRDNRALFWSIFFTAMIGIALGLFAWVDDIAARWFWGSFGGSFLLLLIMNLFKGPSCTSKIKTAVQEEEVPAFRRVRKTEKALERVRELVAAAQGSLGAAEIQNRMAPAVPPLATPDAPPPLAPLSPPPPPPPPST